MGLFELQKPRQFKIETYYYNPEKELSDDKPRVHFRRIRKSERIEKKSPVRLIAALILVLWAIIYLSRQGEPIPKDDKPVSTFQVEEVQVVD